MLDVVLEDPGQKTHSLYNFCFNPCCAGCSSGSMTRLGLIVQTLSFNPCCAGCSSGSLSIHRTHGSRLKVSILVVLDVVLEATNSPLANHLHEFQSLLCWM